MDGITEALATEVWEALTDWWSHGLVVESYHGASHQFYVEYVIGDDGVPRFLDSGTIRLRPDSDPEAAELVWVGLDIPAELPPFLTAQALTFSTRLATPVAQLGYRGHLNIDAIATDTGEIVFNEVNARWGGSLVAHDICARLPGERYADRHVASTVRDVQPAPLDDVLRILREHGLHVDRATREGVLVLACAPCSATAWSASSSGRRGTARGKSRHSCEPPSDGFSSAPQRLPQAVLGRTLSLVDDAVVPAALALALLRATGSASALGIVLACAMVPRLVLLPVGGVMADRFNARTVAVCTDLVRCAMQLFTGFQLLSGHPHIVLVAAAEMLGAAASAFAMPTMSPLVSGTLPAETRQRANSLLGTANSLAKLGGPAVAGMLIWAAGPGWAFVLDAATFAASAALLASVRVPHVKPPKRSFRADLVEGWAEVRSHDWYWSSLIVHGLWCFTASVFLALGPAVAVHSLGGEETWVAVLQSGSVGLLLGSLAASRTRLRRPVLAGDLALTLYALPLGLLAVPAPAPVVIAAYGVGMAGLGFLGPVWETAVQNSGPSTRSPGSPPTTG